MTIDQHRPSGAEPGRGDAEEPLQHRHTTLPSDDQAAERARRATREALAAWQLDQLAETTVLLVSELVTNAVLHAGVGAVPITLILKRQGTWLRIEVRDADPRWPQPRIPTGLAESGFGLMLVDALASKWGVGATAAGKSVWAEIGTY